MGLFLIGMDGILQLMKAWRPIAYLDDVAVVTQTVEESVQVVKEAHWIAARFDFRLNLQKTKELTKNVDQECRGGGIPTHRSTRRIPFRTPSECTMESDTTCGDGTARYAPVY